MGIFSGNNDELILKLGHLEAKAEMLQRQNDELRQEKLALQARIDNLQDAVIAIKNPQAYRALQDDKLIRDWDEDAANRPSIPGSLGDEVKAFQQVTRMLEGPLVRSADDLFSLLGRSQGVPVHGPVGDPKES